MASTAPIAALSVGEATPPTIVPTMTPGIASIGSASSTARRRAPPGQGLAAWIGVLAPEEGDRPEEQPRQQQAGKDSGDEHVAHRHLREDGVDDEDDRGRDDRAQQPAEGGDAHREPLVVARLLHLRHHDLAHHRDLRRRRAQDGGDQHVGEQVHVGEPALHRTDEGGSEAHETRGDARGVHDLADQDEQRYGEEAEIVEALEQLERVGLEQDDVPGTDDESATAAQHRTRPEIGGARGTREERRRRRSMGVFVRSAVPDDVVVA